MIDSRTCQEIQVTQDATNGPYIMVPKAQLPRLREILDLHTVSYWVGPNAISLDGKPAIAFVNLGRSGDAKKVQAILDAVA